MSVIDTILLVSATNLNLAVRSVVGHDLADLLFLGFGETVAFHRQGLEGGLSSEEYEQWRHASITVFKPFFIS